MSQERIPLNPGGIYHVYTHANGSENLFREDENYRYFMGKYGEYVHPIADTFAYCLMPNHLHLMVRIKEEDEILKFLKTRKPTLQGFQTLGGLAKEDLLKPISQQFSHLFNGYTQAFNKRNNRRGSLFIPKFHRRAVTSNSYFTCLIAYVHKNPVHHKFVRDINDWPYSSWSAYLSDKRTKVCTAEGLEWFGGLEAFRTFHQQMCVEDWLGRFGDV